MRRSGRECPQALDTAGCYSNEFEVYFILRQQLSLPFVLSLIPYCLELKSSRTRDVPIFGAVLLFGLQVLVEF